MGRVCLPTNESACAFLVRRLVVATRECRRRLQLDGWRGGCWMLHDVDCEMWSSGHSLSLRDGLWRKWVMSSGWVARGCGCSDCGWFAGVGNSNGSKRTGEQEIKRAIARGATGNQRATRKPRNARDGGRKWPASWTSVVGSVL